VLLALQRRLGEWKGKLRLCGMNPLLMDSFRQCGLDRILPHYDDLENARSVVETGLKTARGK
jgi:anti-anti-sigma regulatory factor